MYSEDLCCGRRLEALTLHLFSLLLKSSYIIFTQKMLQQVSSTLSITSSMLCIVLNCVSFHIRQIYIVLKTKSICTYSIAPNLLPIVYVGDFISLIEAKTKDKLCDV